MFVTEASVLLVQGATIETPGRVVWRRSVSDLAMSMNEQKISSDNVTVVVDERGAEVVCQDSRTARFLLKRLQQALAEHSS